MGFKLGKLLLLMTLTISMLKSGNGDNTNFNRQGINLHQRRGVILFKISTSDATDALNGSDLDLDKFLSSITSDSETSSSHGRIPETPGRSARDIKQKQYHQSLSKHLVNDTENQSGFTQIQNLTTSTNSTKADATPEEGGVKPGVLIAVGIVGGIVALALVLCYCIPIKRIPGSRSTPGTQPRHVTGQDHGKLPPATIPLIGLEYKLRLQRAAERMAAEAQQQELQQQHYVPVWQPIPGQNGGAPEPRQPELLPPASVYYKKASK